MKALATQAWGAQARIDKVGMVANICNLGPEEVVRGRFHPWGPLAFKPRQQATGPMRNSVSQSKALKIKTNT